MGNCYEKEIDPIELVQNEIELSEYLRQEKYLINKYITKSFRKNQDLIDATNSSKDFKVITKLKGILNKLDGNFSQVVFYDIIVNLEIRFKKEIYKEFDEVKSRFKRFYKKNYFNLEYNSMMLEGEEFNEFLDSQLVKVIKK